MSSSSRLRFDLHSTSLMCACPACLAALGLSAKAGALAPASSSRQVSPAMSDISRSDIAGLGAGLRSTSREAASLPATPVVPAVSSDAQSFPFYAPYLPSSSGNSNVDALLAGQGNWWYSSIYAGTYETSDGIAGIRHSLTYSFATYDITGRNGNGFSAMSYDEQQQVRAALGYISSLFDISFTEVASGQGDINYAMNDQGTTSAGFAYYPNTLPASVVYLNIKSFSSGSDLSIGTYGWEVLLHETGHALGLKHPGNYNAGGGTTAGPFLPFSTDNRGNTIMSYINVPASLVQIGGYSIGTISPTTYMMYDFQALQYLYGVNRRNVDASWGYGGVNTVLAQAAPTNQTFSFSGYSTQYETLYAVGANNTLDLTYEDLSSYINLNAGTVSSIGERLTDADLERGISYISNVHQYDKTKTNANGQSETFTLFNGQNNVGIAPGAEIDTVKLGSGAATIIGNNNGDTFSLGSGAAIITGGTGDDTFNIYGNNYYYEYGVNSTLNGGGGNNTAIFSDSRLDYIAEFTSNEGVVFTNLDGHGNSFTLRNFQTLQFSDGTLSLSENIAPPTVTARQAEVAASRLQSFTFSDLFSTSVTQSNPFIKFDFYVPSPASGQGKIEVDGVSQPIGSDIVVTANSYSSLTFVGSGTTVLYARVFDGLRWSGYTQVVITAPIDQPPSLSALSAPLVRPGTTLAVSSLFSVSDPESDPITRYRFLLAPPSYSGLYGDLEGNFVTTNSDGTREIDAASLSSVTFTTGAGSDTLYVQAFDGISWSAWKGLTIAGTNLRPVVTALSSTVSATHLQSFGFSNLFASSDPQGSAIAQYAFYEDSLPGSADHGVITVNGVAQSTGAWVIVQASALSSLSYTASGSDVLYAKVFDGYTWSASQQVSIAAPVDRAPFILASSLSSTLRPGDRIAVSTLFSAADPDHDPVTWYRFYDAGINGSRLAVSTVVNPADTVFEASASVLGSVDIIAGTGADTLYVKAFDGVAWGAWTAITVNGQNLRPVVTALSSTVSATHLQSFGFSNLFASSDPQGSAIAQYAFYEDSLPGSADHGVITVNGVAQSTGAWVIVQASALSSLSYTASGSDVLYAKVFDGYTWSASQQVSIAAPANHTPIVIASAPTGATVDRSSRIAASLLFSITDQDGDATTRYRFYDESINGSLIALDATAQSAGAVVEIAASDLASVGIIAGNGSDTLYVKAFDGIAWGGWTAMTVTGVYAPPTVTAISSILSASHLQSFGFSDLFQAATPHGPAPKLYDFYDLDLSGTGNHGTIEVNGAPQAAGTDVVVAASALSTLRFVASGSDALYARVYDGFSWSAYKQVNITAPADHTPTVIAAGSIATPRPGGTLFASTLFSTTDVDGDSITRYRFYDDGANGGRLSIGSALQSVGAVFDITASDLASIGVVAGNGADTLYVKAFDGVAWGAWTPITVSGANLAPTVTAPSTSVSASRLQSFSFSQLFSASDPQGSAITKYDFYDYDASGTGANGAIQVNGVSQPTGTDVIVNAADLSSLSFVAGGSDILYARVFDGFTWSAYKRISVSAPVDHAPVIASKVLNSPVPYIWTDLFTASDPDGDAITTYRFYAPATNEGQIFFHSLNQTGNVFDVASGDFPNTVYYSPGFATDQVYIKAYDGVKWSAWTAITMPSTSPVFSPVPTPLSASFATLHSAALGSPLSLPTLGQSSTHGFGFAASS
jgi:hypothetical protein